MINVSDEEGLSANIDLVSLLIEMQKLKNEKQQLISFLEEKVKVCQEELDNFFMEDEENDFSLEFEIKKEILQEVLDFVEGNEKNY